MSINPARTLASALPGGMWDAIWIYLTAPMLGMWTATRLYSFVTVKAGPASLCGHTPNASNISHIHCECSS